MYSERLASHLDRHRGVRAATFFIFSAILVADDGRRLIVARDHIDPSAWGKTFVLGLAAGCLLFAAGLTGWLALQRWELQDHLRRAAAVSVGLLWFLCFVATHPKHADDSVRAVGEVGVIVTADTIMLGVVVMAVRGWWLVRRAVLRSENSRDRRWT